MKPPYHAQPLALRQISLSISRACAVGWHTCYRGRMAGAWGRCRLPDCLAVGQALRGGVVATGILSEAEYDRLYQLAQAELSAPKGTGVLPFHVACGQRAA